MLRLEWSTRRLPYLLLGRQAAAASTGDGVFTSLEGILTRLDNRVNKTIRKTSIMPEDGRKRAVRPRRR